MLYIGIILVLFGGGGLIVLWLISQATRKKPICQHCGQEIASSKYIVISADGSGFHVDCFQKVLDDQGGTCPVCGKPMLAGEDLYRYSKKWHHQFCYRASVYKKEGVTPETIAVLANATRIFCGIPTKTEAIDNFVWAVSDPLYGLYRNSLKKVGDMSQETARTTIEKLYIKFPKSVEAFLTNWVANIPSTRIVINSLIGILKAGRVAQANDPLTILRTRYAKGEITREEYEEKKKVLQAE